MGTHPLSADPARVAEIKAGIDMSDMVQITSFGEGAQRDLARIADRILEQARSRDRGDTGALLCEVVARTRRLDPATLEMQDVLTRLFGGPQRAISRFQLRFESVVAHIDRITGQLERQIEQLRRGMMQLDGLHEQTRESARALEAYIAAGKSFADVFRRTRLRELEAKAKSGADLAATQRYEAALHALYRLEKRVLSLEQTRKIIIRQLPQIRVMQGHDTTFAKGLETAVDRAIPNWKQQMAQLLGLVRQEAMREPAQKSATIEMRRKSSGTMTAEEIGTLPRRRLVDTETLSRANRELIDTIQRVLQEQARRRRNRAAIEQELDRHIQVLNAALAKMRV
jgi:uncharacterized protein YaaN involved in tellurite resistance